MNPLYEHLNDELERQNGSFWSAQTSPDLPQSTLPDFDSDQEVQALVAIARRIQLAPAVQVDADFADRLEQRILVHNAVQRMRRAQISRWNRLSVRSLLRAHPVFSIALSCCLLVLLLALGIVIASAQITNPNNPLYAINQWEQDVRLSLSGSPVARAELDLQFAADRLNTLADLANPSDTQAYEQQLEDLSQQVENAVQAINQIPAGTQRSQLQSNLAALETHARQVLRGFLPRLNLQERLATTDALADLGDTVPHLQSVQLILPPHSGELATIIIDGSGLESGAQLVIDGQVMGNNGSLNNGVDTFMVRWNGNNNQQSYTIGILNPDGTFAQITLVGSSWSAGNGNGNGGGNGNGNHGNNGNHGGNGNGNGNHGDNGNHGGNGNGNKNGNGNGNGGGNGNGNGNGNHNGGGNGNGNGNGNHGDNGNHGGNGNKNGNGNGNGNHNGEGNGNGHVMKQA
ncbi:MAG TPA: DUF5667 domain-containing protein [Ktedonobacteraceae bacterium]|nr:DUF5667 domain-containing protein [Ktedonobacteraceae bacterium]